MATLLFRGVAVLVLSSCQGVLARRATDEAIESNLASSGAEELGTNDGAYCCSRLRNGETPCGCDDVEGNNFEHICRALQSKIQIYDRDSQVCSEFAGPFTGEAAECYLAKEKCVKCSVSSIFKKCGMAKAAARSIAKPCSALDQERKDELCGSLTDKSKTTPDGLYLTSSLISDALMKENIPYACSPGEIEGMCEVAPLCPELVANKKYMSKVCEALKSRRKVDGGKNVFNGVRASQELKAKGITCSSRDVYAVCGVVQPYQSPCPEFEDTPRLATSYCKHIKSGTMVEGKPFDYSLASELLEKEKGITCSAGNIAKICKRNDRAKP